MKHLGTSAKTWQLWERPAEPRPFQLQPRDIEILYEVLRHRFLQPRHVHALFGGSAANLAVRLRLLWQHHYLERPKAVRPTRILTEELVYGLGKAGARMLEHYYPELRIGHLDWTETPKKQIGLPYIDHQLGIATFMVVLKLAGDQNGVRLHWKGHHADRFRIDVPGEPGVVRPDAHFALEVPDAGVAHHFLEMDRGSVSLKRMEERYLQYLAFWKLRAGDSFPYFRVITVCENQDHCEALRRVGRRVIVDGAGDPWRALLFVSIDSLTLTEPAQILRPVFWYADGLNPVSLLAGSEGHASDSVGANS
jgi:hypothetical protein